MLLSQTKTASRIIATYNEAQVDYRELENIMGEIGTELSGEELNLKDDLDRAAPGDDSEQRWNDRLTRAIDVSATSIYLMSQEKTTLHKLEALSFGIFISRINDNFFPQLGLQVCRP
jgi:hypothetical protein